MRLGFAEAGNDIEKYEAKRASLKGVRDYVAAIKREVARRVTSVIKARDRFLGMHALMFKRQVEMELSKEVGKTLDHNLASLMKELAGAKVENAFLRWGHDNLDESIAVLENDVGSTLKVVAELAQYNVSQVARSVDSACSGH